MAGSVYALSDGDLLFTGTYRRNSFNTNRQFMSVFDLEGETLYFNDEPARFDFLEADVSSEALGSSDLVISDTAFPVVDTSAVIESNASW